MAKKTKHTLEFLLNNFYDSKRSTKSIHKLNPTALYILGYIIRSIDKSYKSRKKLSSQIYQAQIAKFCHTSVDTVQRQTALLVKKRLIKHDKKIHIYTIGWLFHALSNIQTSRNLRLTQEGPQIAAYPRRAAICGSSNTSHLSNSNDVAEESQTQEQEPKSIDEIIINNKKAKEAQQNIRDMVKGFAKTNSIIGTFRS